MTFRLILLIATTVLLVTGCKPKGTMTDKRSHLSSVEGDATAKKASEGDPAAEGSEPAADPVENPDGESKPESGNPSTEAAPVGEALEVSGDFKDLNLKYMSAVHRPAYSMSGAELPATLTFIFSEYSPGTKRIKEYKCKDCDDSVTQCFCHKAENKDNERCKAGTAIEYDEFNLYFSAKNALVPLADGTVHQVDDKGWPAKKEYEIKTVPADFLDPAYAENTTHNGLEGLTVSYRFVASDVLKSKFRSTAAGTIKFPGEIPAAGKNFEIDVDLTFKANTLTGDSGPDQKIKGKFKGPVLAYKEQPAVPTDCNLPQKYLDTVFEN